MDSGVSTIQLGGAFCSGAIVRWYVYIINRHRKEGMQMSDLVTLIAVMGGGAVSVPPNISSDGEPVFITDLEHEKQI